MAEASYTVTLRIWHPTHSGQAITKAIGLQPYVSQTVGEPRVNPVGEKLGGEYKKTGCAFRLREKTLGYFVDGIRDLVPTLEKGSALLENHSAERWTFRTICRGLR